MMWHDQWQHAFGAPPPDATSREVSVQEVLAELISGHRCAWFEPYEPTDRGKALLQALSRAAFGDAAEDIPWFVSEYELPVPPAWRTDIPFTYRCPDFACGDGRRVLIVELKTERGSYQGRQMSDYLRLARHKLPDSWTDVALLAPHRPGAKPQRDDRQRYAELTWADVPDFLTASFPGDGRAERLAAFLAADLATPHRAASTRQSQEGAREPVASQQEVDDADRCQAAVLHALCLAPSVAAAKSGDRTERGIDVAFQTVDVARRAQKRITQALAEAGFAEQVSVWLWQPSSTGVPTTEAGATAGRELRLAPRLRRKKHHLVSR